MTASTHKIERGEILFKEGDPSDCIYYVRSGQLQAFIEADKQRSALGEIMPGEFVGESGVLQSTPRNASVIALEDTVLEQYSKDAFIESISHDPEKSVQLLYSLSVRTRNLVLLNMQIAEQIAEHTPAFSYNPVRSFFSLSSRLSKQIKRLIQKREYKTYSSPLPEKPKNGSYYIEKNQALFLEGQESHFVARLINGRLKAVKSLHSAHDNIGIISPDEFVGEMGLLEGAPRSLTIIATQDSEVELLDQDSFLHLISADTNAIFTLIMKLSHRAMQLNHRLNKLTQKHADILAASTLTQAKQLLQSITDISQLTGRMLEQDLYTLRNALKQEAIAVQDILDTYYRYINGLADKQEMDKANAEFRNFLKTLGLGALIIIPGSVITIPLIVKTAKSFGIDILPKSRTHKNKDTVD